ncbi:hypothetical protein ACROYT_G008854 [Oculina patagonica]
MITILGTLLFLLVQGCASTHFRVQSVIREASRSGGNLLKVACGAVGADTRPLSFTGLKTTDPTTELYLEHCNAKRANVLKFRAGNSNYYLSAERAGKVQLRKLSNFPSEDKYFFKIRQTSKGAATISLKSLATGQYLQSDSNGGASMKTVKSPELNDGQPRDRKTWFRFLM